MITMISIEQLARRAQTGDKRSYGALVEAFQDMAVGYAYGILGDMELARDAAQEAFIAAYRDIAGLRDPAAFAGWLRRVIRTHCNRITRRAAIRAGSLDDALEIPSPDPEPDAAAILGERREAVRQAIASLPEHERSVVALFYIADHSHEELSAFLDLPLSTVKNRLHSARKKLHGRLESMIKDDLHEERPSRGEEFTAGVMRMLKAAYDGDATTVRELLRARPALADAPGAHDKRPLHYAAESDRREIVALLLAAGVDIEAATSWGMTPLQWAANMGNREAAAILLDHGARLDLWSAAGLGMIEEVRAFWKDGGFIGGPQLICADPLEGRYLLTADPACIPAAISGAFQIAARNGRVETARFLLDRGADINSPGFWGATGLHWAAGNGHRTMVEFLIASGADTELRDPKWNATAADWAAQGGHEAIAALLTGPGEGAPM